MSFNVKGKIKVITVDNGTNDYYGNFTSQENTLIRFYSFGDILHLFSGKSEIGKYRVDYKFGNIKKDVFEYLPTVKENSVDCVIIDAPYNQKFADKYQKIGDTPKQFIIFANTKDTTTLFNEIIRINPYIIILKSWNYYIVKGYHLNHGYLCYAGGYRKPTLLLIMEKGD